MTIARTLAAALRVQWRAAPVSTVVLIVLTAICGAVAATGAWLTKELLDELAGAADPTRARLLAVGVAAVASGAVVLFHATHYVEVAIRGRIGIAVETALVDKLVDLPDLRYFEDPAFHAKLRLADGAAREAPQRVADLLQAALRTCVTAASLAGVVWIVWPPMTALLLASGVVGLLAQLQRSRHERRVIEQLVHSYRWRDAYRALLVEPRAAKELRLFGAGALVAARLRERLGAIQHGELQRERTAVRAQIAIAIAGTVVAIAGGVLVVERVLDHRLALGDVVLFTAAIAGIQGAFADLVTRLGEAGTTLALFAAYLEVIALPAREAGGRPVPPLASAIELRDVWFRYAPDQPWVLRGVNLVIAAGTTTGLVGLNGSGKSTLLKLLAGFYHPERGTISWDGIDLRELDPTALRARMTACFQDFMTYDLSAAENIGLGDVTRRGGIDDVAAIRVAARRADIDRDLSALPDGYATLLSRVLTDDDPAAAHAVTLSGGQWQRVALARALLRPDPDVLVLDEATAHVDAAGEQRLHAALASHATRAARIIVAHQLGALRGATTIAVLDGGVIAELGSHDELVAQSGTYARVFARQAEVGLRGVA